MKKCIALVSMLMLVGLLFQSAEAQENKEQLWLVGEEVVKPDMVDQYEEVSEDLIKLCNKENFPYSFNLWKLDYFTYDLWYPIDELNDIKKIDDAWDDIMLKFGEENIKKFQDCIESQFDKVMAVRLDLSYQPDSPRLSAEDVKFSRLQELYLKKGSEKKVEELFKRANTLFKEKGIENVTFIGEGRIGYEQPVYFRWSYGENRMDLIKQDIDRGELLGEEWRSINEEMVTYLKRIEELEDQWIKFLSYEKEAP